MCSFMDVGQPALEQELIRGLASQVAAWLTVPCFLSVCSMSGLF